MNLFQMSRLSGPLIVLVLQTKDQDSELMCDVVFVDNGVVDSHTCSSVTPFYQLMIRLLGPQVSKLLDRSPANPQVARHGRSAVAGHVSHRRIQARVCTRSC